MEGVAAPVVAHVVDDRAQDQGQAAPRVEVVDEADVAEERVDGLRHVRGVQVVVVGNSVHAGVVGLCLLQEALHLLCLQLQLHHAGAPAQRLPARELQRPPSAEPRTRERVEAPEVKASLQELPQLSLHGQVGDLHRPGRPVPGGEVHAERRALHGLVRPGHEVLNAAEVLAHEHAAGHAGLRVADLEALGQEPGLLFVHRWHVQQPLRNTQRYIEHRRCRSALYQLLSHCFRVR
mmetsp:Transcript_70973/g.208005  ORF Transcript_70973/g.208005 Transcript_70973/m.208005 type:complete len:235 (+) Transcript_70973:465-1169(+)